MSFATRENRLHKIPVFIAVLYGNLFSSDAFIQTRTFQPPILSTGIYRTKIHTGFLKNEPSQFSSSDPSSTKTQSFLKQNMKDESENDIGLASQSRRHLLFSMLTSPVIAASLATQAKAINEDTLTLEASTTIAENSASVASAFSLRSIMKPPLDKREYEYFTLPNGLRVLLCSDPSSNSAAAAMDVHVGAESDPNEVPGLAHFNEHMLFLGTKKYPKEESFSTFLSANGGFSNAFTDCENTVYYFDMEAELESKLNEGLSRFGSFFSEPLFTESATGRELNAIESENSKNLQSDIFRIYQIEKSRANTNHPYSKFFTGNKKTLLEDTKRANIDLRSELIQFYNTYYSSNQMTLAVVAPQSLSTMKKMVTEAFGDIPNREAEAPEKAWKNIPPFQLGSSVIPSFGNVVEVVPVQDLRQVSLMFPIVYSEEDEKKNIRSSKPDFYVSHLIGHEGPGSLLSYLKKKRLGEFSCSSE